MVRRSAETNPLLSFSGLSSGLDTDAIVEGLVKVARIPIDKLQEQNDALTTQSTTLSTISTLLSHFQTLLETMDTPQTFAQYTATSGNSSVVTAVAGSDAQVGTYNILVQNLATNFRGYSNGFYDANTVGLFGTGTISFQVGSNAAVDLTVDGNSTLQTVNDAINNLGINLDSTLVYDGSNYYLALQCSETGASNAITITETTTTLGFNSPGNTIQQGSDASVKLDNLITIGSASNTLSDLVGGVTFQLLSTSNSAVNVTVASNTSSMLSEIESFVTAYNAVVQAMNSCMAYTGKYEASSLQGDFTLLTLQRSLSSVIISSVTGATGSYSALSQIGIATQLDGTLAIDKVALNAAIAADSNSVVNLFALQGGSNGVAQAMETLIENYNAYTTGILYQRVQGIQTNILYNDTQMLKLEEQVENYEKEMRSKYTELEVQMSKIKADGGYLTQMNNNRRNNNHR